MSSTPVARHDGAELATRGPVSPASRATRISLIDLSSLFRKNWHATEHEEISAAYNRTVSDVTAAAAGYDAVAVCVDRPPYKRKEIDPQYKAHRETQPATMYEQLRQVEETLGATYHVVGADGLEADDIIATLAVWAKEHGHAVDIHSADKDLMQLVGDDTRVISTATGQVYGEPEVKAKWGVGPDLIADLLALTGDKSDNIPGIDGVGPKTAAKWLSDYGSVEGVITNADKLGRFAEAVKSGRDTITRSWRLAQLVTDAPINPERIMEQKQREDAYVFGDDDDDPSLPDDRQRDESAAEASALADRQRQVINPKQAVPVAEVVELKQAAPQQQALAVVGHQQPVSWERSLEPHDMRTAWSTANILYKSRMFGDWPNPEAILSVVMTGRSMGLDASTSLRSFHYMKNTGKAVPHAWMLVGRVKKSRDCLFFTHVSSDAKHATFTTKRRGDEKATTHTYTIEQALAAGLSGGNWKARPDEMLRKTCAVQLARLVYPDHTMGLYTADEMGAEV